MFSKSLRAVAPLLSYLADNKKYENLGFGNPKGMFATKKCIVSHLF